VHRHNDTWQRRKGKRMREESSRRRLGESKNLSKNHVFSRSDLYIILSAVFTSREIELVSRLTV
jgi:hypothetical protein